MTQNGSIALGIDIGGSGIKGALVDVNRGVLVGDRLRIPTPNPAAPEAVSRIISDLTSHFHWSGPIGCAFPAVINDGISETATNIDSGWIGLDAGRLFASRAGSPVTLLNDADAAGLAEVRFGAGRDQPGLVILFTLGTGIGSALLMDGKLIPNSEFGRLILRGREAEEQASSRARKENDWDWQTWAAHLEEFLLYVEMFLRPNLFILGGGISQEHSHFLHLLQTKTPVVPAELRNNAGIVGAALATSSHGLEPAENPNNHARASMPGR